MDVDVICERTLADYNSRNSLEVLHMVKNLTVRFAWHDNKWNGRICADPTKNHIYCAGSHSLVSPRISRRINLEIEEAFKGKDVSEVVKEKNYLPPCYWSINAFGKGNFLVEDPHPFNDMKTWSQKFKAVPPLKYSMKDFSVFTWCFKLSFELDKEMKNISSYPDPAELEERVRDYIAELKKGKTIVFFYANYSNPVTGDDYKYLLLGAGVLENVEFPQEYKFTEELLKDLRSRKKMQNFPTLAWEFPIVLNKNKSFFLPFQEYVNRLEEKDGIDRAKKLSQLEEVATPILDDTLKPHFKYVSMHMQHDKAIYLLYLLRSSLRKMKEQRIVNLKELNEKEERIEKLLSLAWQQRGEYPGFKNVVSFFLKNDFDNASLKKRLPEIENTCVKNFGSVKSFLDTSSTIDYSKMSNEMTRAFQTIEENKDQIRFLSIFDFTILQFQNIKKIINEIGFREVKHNPYLLLEKYIFDPVDELTADDSDFGLDLFQFDIALIPDPNYAKWRAQHKADSPQRIRAVITKILYDTAKEEGHSCLMRSEILEQITKYPLYYINDELNLDVTKLIEFEKQAVFKEKFVFVPLFKDNQVIYQLREIRNLEKIIEDYIKKMIQKKYSISQTDKKDIEEMVSEEHNTFGKKLDLSERKKMYENALNNGMFFLSGKAGTGKTTAIVNLIRKFDKDGKTPIYVLTPTGKANLVISDRLKKSQLQNKDLIKVSTIHRFLYRELWEFFDRTSPEKKGMIFRLNKLIERMTSGKLEVLNDFIQTISSGGARFNPKIVIIDEASMVNEVLMATLFSLLNSYGLEHLIIVGDEKQLPPIGIGRPFIDSINYIKKNDLEDTNYIHLKTNLRFDASKNLGILAEIFSGDKKPFPNEIQKTLSKPDETLELRYFKDQNELGSLIKEILLRTGKTKPDQPLSQIFADIFEDGEKIKLDKIQLLTPRRVGNFGTMSINVNTIRGGNSQFTPRTKLICEENIYVDAYLKGKKKKTLGLANGSIGYIKSNEDVEFEDINDLKNEYYSVDTRKIDNEVTGEWNVLKQERVIDFGYAITVHKAQGSDFDDVIFIVSQFDPFVVRELLYTAFTRPKNKLYLLLHSDLQENLPLNLSFAYENSAVEKRETMLFGYKVSPFKPYILTLKNGQTVEFKSKIEYIIGKKFDDLNVTFDYEPQDFFSKYRIYPDFKVIVGDKIFFLEHLGMMNNTEYRNRWFQKFDLYKEAEITEDLITMSESEEKSNIERNLEVVVENMRLNNLVKTEGGYSKHHYYI